MAGYIIAQVKITDMDLYQQYMKATPATIARYNGKFIVRGGDVTTLEGEPSKERVVIIEFPSLEIAKAWYNSAEYQAAKKLREGAAEATFYAISGV